MSNCIVSLSLSGPFNLISPDFYITKNGTYFVLGSSSPCEMAVKEMVNVAVIMVGGPTKGMCCGNMHFYLFIRSQSKDRDRLQLASGWLKHPSFMIVWIGPGVSIYM